MAKQAKTWNILTPTIITIFTILSSTRHTYVTALTSQTNNSDDAIRLLHDVIDPFDNRVRPILNQSRPIEVYLTYNLVNLIDVDEINQRITVNIWINFTWWDEFRTWNPDDYGGNDVIHPNPPDIWRPKTVLTNSADERDVFKNADSPLSLYSTGETRWYIGGVYYYVCAMDLTYFPYDQQVCQAQVMSTNLGTEIYFNATREIRMANYVANGEWDFVSSHVSYILSNVSVEEKLGFILMTVTFKRLPMYYLINVLIPTMCLSFISLFGFIVPKDSGERASFAITVLLALAVYMGIVSAQLPANSDSFPLISIYIFSLMCLSMLSVLIIVGQLRWIQCNSCSGDSNPKDSDHQGNGFQNGRNENSENEDGLKTMLKNYQHSQNNENNSNNIRYAHSNQVAPHSGVINVKGGDNSQREFAEDNNNDGDIYTNTDDNRKSFWKESPKMYNYNNGRLLKRLKIILLEYDDIILMTVFSILWMIFTLVFVGMISEHP